MRILRGRWAGTALVSPGGRVRPTAEALRGHWLDLLESQLPASRVLDLYAGTGALGLEALSRGAARADFVENDPAALHSLKANIAKLRVRDRTRVFKRDALRWVLGIEPAAYELAFADPPYGSRQADRLVEQWKAAPFSGVLVIEHAARHALPPGGRAHRFDDSTLTVYRAGPAG